MAYYEVTFDKEAIMSFALSAKPGDVYYLCELPKGATFLGFIDKDGRFGIKYDSGDEAPYEVKVGYAGDDDDMA